MMATEMKSAGKEAFIWSINPFESIAAVWKDVVAGSKLAIPHVVGVMKMHHNTIVELELDAVPHSFESRVIVKDVDSIYFLFPVDPAEGPEGIYVKLIESLGMGI